MHIQIKLGFFALFMFAFSLSANAQKDYNQTGKAIQTKAIHLGKTSAVKDLVPIGPISKEKKQAWKKANKAPRNFVGRGADKIVHPELEHQGVDKLRQGILAGTKSADANVIANFDGITSSFGSPHDPSGDIGRDHYVLGINATQIAVYDKGGNELTTFSANTLWQEIGFSSAGDPIILYDQLEDRWIITEFPSGNQLLVAISEDSDPMGSYDVYNFQTPNFPDYPKYGLWEDVITVTTNEQGAGNLTTYFINKAELYKGAEEVKVQRLNLPGNGNTEAGFFVATPVDWTGQTPPKDNKPIFLNLDDSSWGNATEDQIAVTTVDIDWDNPDNTTFETQNIVTSPFDGNPCSAAGFGFSCIPQGGNGGGLDGIPEVIMNQAVYRNFNTHESMVFNFITDVTDGDNLSGIRWVEFRREDAEWYLYQEGTFSPDDGLDRYMAGIAMDGSGNIGLAYNVSSEDEFVGVRFTGRKWDDELGMMTVAEQVLADGVNTINSGARFGDYAQMGIDPINDRTFWYVTEYGKGGGSSSSTRISAFEIERDANDIGAYRFKGATTVGVGSGIPVTIQVNNYGSEEVTEFTAGYTFDNGSEVLETVTQTIAAGESIDYTFPSTLDFPAAGEYSFVAFTTMESDATIVNDTTKTVITAIAPNDAGLVGLNSASSQLCDTETDLSVIISNFGGDTLTSTIVEVVINGVVFYSETWTGSLGLCESETIVIPITGLVNGENVIEASVSMPNNLMDQGPLNNDLMTTVTVVENAITATLNLTFDDYPEEITWELLDTNGQVINNGGPYPGQDFETINVEFCLDSTLCYKFIIYDAFGDGITSGTYTITNEDGGILAMLNDNGNWTQNNNDFCAEFVCMLNAGISTTPAGDNGGTILIVPMNGVGPYMFSIDGGMTFQDNGLFENVPEGDYEIVIQGDGDCLFEGSATVGACTLEATVEFENATDEANGAIIINVTGGTAPFEYSIDGGMTWQSSNLFNDLAPGEYDVRARDGQGCPFEMNITISMTSNVSINNAGVVLIATPNPTDGLFNIYLEGNIQAGNFIDYEIYNVEGKAIRKATLVRYDDSYTSQVSIAHEPSGVYYVRINASGINKLAKVIKL